jgi:fatty acid desaturase
MRDTASPPADERRHLLALIAPYEAPSTLRSLWQIASTLLAYVALEAAMYASLGIFTGSRWRWRCPRRA